MVHFQSLVQVGDLKGSLLLFVNYFDQFHLQIACHCDRGHPARLKDWETANNLTSKFLRRYQIYSANFLYNLPMNWPFSCPTKSNGSDSTRVPLGLKVLDSTNLSKPASKVPKTAISNSLAVIYEF